MLNPNIAAREGEFEGEIARAVRGEWVATASPYVRECTRTARWSVRAAGSFAIIDNSDGQDATPRARKAQAIVAYLASHPGARVSRERIAELLWGDRGDAQARASLRQAVLEIRRVAPGSPKLILSDRQHLWINDEHVELSEAPLDAIGGAESLPFEDLDHVSREFDEWLEVERARRARSLMAELGSQAEDYLARQQEETAQRLIEAMGRIDPFDEEALRLGMRADFQAGHSAAVEQRYQAMAASLREQLGVEPSAETKALHDNLVGQSKSNGSTMAEPPHSAALVPMLFQRRPRLSLQQIVPGRSRSLIWTPTIAMALIVLLVVVGGIWSIWASGGRAIAAEPVKVAVLPFRGSDVDPALADGFSEALLTRLASDDRFQVTGQTSAWQYKDRAVDLRDVGRSLGVDYVVEGAVRRNGEQTRVTAALVRTKDRATMWRREFIGREAQPTLEQAIKSGVVGALGLTVRPAARMSARPKAYPLYLRAKSLMRERTKTGIISAQALLLEAVRSDPGFAAAWAQLGGTARLRGEDVILLDPNDPKGRTLTPKAAVERSLSLDPDLPDGHAMMALILGLNTVEGRAHLNRALELEPRNPQSLYWLGNAHAAAGDFARSVQVHRQAAAIDPLWKRPVSAAAVASFRIGDQAAAQRYVRTIKAGNPEAAKEVEVDVAMAQQDFSRAIGIALADRDQPRGSSQAVAALALISLGYVREGLLVGQLDEVSSAIVLRRAPGRAALLRAARRASNVGDDQWLSVLMTWELARAKRYEDIVALYDARHGVMKTLDQPLTVNREDRANFAGIVGLALAKIGRKSEAARLFAVADEAGKTILANGQVPPIVMMTIAANDAVMGRRERAIAELQKAYADGWRLYDMINGEIGEVPMFDSLRGDPRFERLRRLSVAHRAKERRQVVALGLF